MSTQTPTDDRTDDTTTDADASAGWREEYAAQGVDPEAALPVPFWAADEAVADGHHVADDPLAGLPARDGERGPGADAPGGAHPVGAAPPVAAARHARVGRLDVRVVAARRRPGSGRRGDPPASRARAR